MEGSAHSPGSARASLDHGCGRTPLTQPRLGRIALVRSCFWRRRSAGAGDVAYFWTRLSLRFQSLGTRPSGPGDG